MIEYDLIVKGGKITTASETFVSDIGVKDGKIAAIGIDLKGGAKKTLNAKDRVVIPGGIDVHTHLDMPFMGARTADDFQSGTTSAVCGGTTTIVDFAIQERGKALRKAFDTWSKKADGKSAVDYGFHMIVIDMPKSRLSEMNQMVDEGLSSFKLFMAYPGIFMSDDATIFRAMLQTKENGGMICMHAENGQVIDVLVEKALAAGQISPKYHALTRPMTAEAEATRRAISLAEMAGVPLYIVHLSAGEAMDEVGRARGRGLPIYAETCPQYLYLSYDDYERPGFEGAKFVMSPPLRPKGNETRLWQGVRDNTLQVVSTDHCSFCMQAKPGKPGKTLGKKSFAAIPNGAPGIETRMMLLWDAVMRGKLTANRFVEITSTTPAKLFGMYPRKGTITPGADADLVVIHPKKSYKIQHKRLHMKVDYNPYEGRTVKGLMQDVFVRGKHMVDNGTFIGNYSHGHFIRRAPRMS